MRSTMRSSTPAGTPGTPGSRAAVLAALAVSGAVLVAACASDGRTLRPARPDQNASVSTVSATTTLPVVVDGGDGLDDAFDDPLDGGTSGLDADGDGIVDSTFATLPAGQTAPPTNSDPAGSSDIPGAGGSIAGEQAVLFAPFAPDGPIDPRYTCVGEDISPALSWTAAPAGTVEIALTLTDPDAPGFVHWAMAGIDPTVTAIGEGEVPPGAIVGISSSGVEGYSGPCPPQGVAAHRYVFTVHFLAQQTEVQSGVAGQDLVAAIEGATFGGASVVGTFTSA